ncbi:MAG: FAD-dependent oxidoreductase, partial [Patescibacteria group bacterium]
MFDLIIIGGGPAAFSAAIYAGRKKLKTLILTANIGGQIAQQPTVENYAGYLEKGGFKLAQNMKAQIKGMETVELKEGVEFKAAALAEKDGFFSVACEKENFDCRSVIVAAGKHPRELGVSGEKEFYNKGVTYCAVCDAPLFAGKITAVVGGGNTALDFALLLAKFAEKVYLIHRRKEFTGDIVSLDKVKTNAKIEIITDTVVEKISGDKFVSGVIVKNAVSGEIKEIKLEGVFVAIGSIPNTEFVKDLVKLNEYGEIIIDHKTCETNVPGIFAAGDITDVVEKQA